MYSLFGPPSYKEGCLNRYTNSRLLNLLLELRKTIYEYAVTYPGGLDCVGDKFRTGQSWGRDKRESMTVKLQAMEDASIEGAALNPLKFTCRQLNGETSGTLLRSNATHFDTDHRRIGRFPLWKILDCFLQQAKPDNLALLKKVAIATEIRHPNGHLIYLFRLLG
jgi:hypothetical protein